jgi:DNA-binding NarL/FixJ family response regulator
MKHVRLLIADDHPHILKLLSDLLSDDFCIVGTVSDGKAQITAAVALHPHLIIIAMPTMIGLDPVRHLEALMPDIKVIVLTDHEEPEFAAASRAAGVSTFPIKKEMPALYGKIRAIMQDLFIAHPQQFIEKSLTDGDDCALVQKGMSSWAAFERSPQ